MHSPPNWLATARAQANIAAPADRLPLFIGAAKVGSVAPAIAAYIQTHCAGSLLAVDSSLGLGFSVPPSDANQHLARIANALNAGGFLRGWRNELLAIESTDLAEPLAIERGAVRALGLPSTAVHLCATNAAGQFWLQRRAAHKATDPNKLDTLAGGLVAAGESVAEGLMREAYEEAGVPRTLAQQAVKLGVNAVRRPVTEGYMIEHSHAFHLVVPNSFNPNNIDGEASGFVLLSRAEVGAEIQAGNMTLEAVLAVGLAW